MIAFFSSLYFKTKFYIVGILLVGMFLLGHAFPAIYLLGKISLLVFGVISLADIFILYRIKQGIVASRICPERFSNGDNNDVVIKVESHYGFNSDLEIIDEIPHQFQIRDLLWHKPIKSGENLLLKYQIRPTKRGEYDFGAINIYTASPIGFINRRYRFAENQICAVYPSYLQMKKYEMVAFSKRLSELGIKKVRKIGQSMEFEQIKEYVFGDDPRNINWKASARRNNLMVNQYEDEKSQRIYSVIDKGRLMKMPFDGLSLLDYAINSSLVISNIAVKKQDKAGLVSFSNKLSHFLKADKRPTQLRTIQHLLYSEKTKYLESNFELLTSFISRRITNRSLLMIYTNFESYVSFKRQLGYFKALSRRHLVLVIFFENTGLNELIESQPRTVEEIYDQSIAEQFTYDKHKMVRELSRLGILSILTKPENLTINTINKYLEIKARSLL